MTFQIQAGKQMKAVSESYNDPGTLHPHTQDSVRTASSLSTPSEETVGDSKSKHSKQAKEHPHTKHERSTFPMAKRGGWFSSLLSRLRPSGKPNLLSFESLTKIRCFGEIMIRLSDRNINKVEWLKCRGYVSPLHFLLQHRPPLVVVNTVIMELKTLGHECPEVICDSKGRNCLHIACATVPSNNVAVIARLVNGQSMFGFDNPAAVVDHQKMLPLHYACTGKVSTSDAENRVLLIRFLTEYFPQGSFAINNRGKTPSDLVRLHSKNPEMLMVLYQCIVDQRKTAKINSVPDCNKAIKQRSEYDLIQCNTDDKQLISTTEMIQKYTKSEHRRDGLAALVQKDNESLFPKKERLSEVFDRSDEISELESMYTSSYAADYCSSIPTNEGKNTETVIAQAAVRENDDLRSIKSEGVDSKHENVQRENNDNSSNDIVQSLQEYWKMAEESVDISTNSDDSLNERLSSDSTSSLQYSISEECDESRKVTDTECPESQRLSTTSINAPTQKLYRQLVDTDGSSISASSESDDTLNTSPEDDLLCNDVIPSIQKKTVKFNDSVEIQKISSISNQVFLCNLDLTDPTESETSTSNNPLDDSDRGAVLICETPTTASLTSKMMQRYGGNKLVDHCVVEPVNEDLPAEPAFVPIVELSTNNMYFL